MKKENRGTREWASRLGITGFVAGIVGIVLMMVFGIPSNYYDNVIIGFLAKAGPILTIVGAAMLVLFGLFGYVVTSFIDALRGDGSS